MQFLVPESWGTDLLEYNRCHTTDTGMFCSAPGGGSKPAGEHTAKFTDMGRHAPATVEHLQTGDWVDAATAVGNVQRHPGGFYRVQRVVKKERYGIPVYLITTSAGTREMKPGYHIADRYLSPGSR